MTNVALPLNPQAIAELQAELARRRALRPPDLAPHLSLVDMPGHKLNVLTKSIRHIFLKGGRGSAKSWAVAEILIKLARTAPLRILCTREYQKSIADSVHKLLVDTITRLGLDDWFTVTQNSIKSKAGAEFIFEGLHNNAKEIKSKEGVDICWVEEGQSTTKESLKFLLPTIRKAGSRLIFTYNPENDNDPIHVMAMNPPPDSETVHVNFDENPYFSKELADLRQWYLDAISNAETDVERAQAQSDYDHIWLGETKKINDEIIFSGKCVVQDFPDDLWKKAERLHFGGDFGFSRDPSVLTRSFILEETLYVEYEAYGVGVELNEMDQFYAAVPGSKDWPIKGDASRPETISHIRGFGYNISAADKWPGSVEDGIAHIRAFKKIIIHTRCKHTAQEAKQYKYKKDRITGEVLSVIIDKHNHCIAEGQLVHTGRGLIPIEKVQRGDQVLTRAGMRRVQSAWQASPDRELWEVRADGHTLLATPDHQVFTVNRGFVRIDALRYDDELLIYGDETKWLSKSSALSMMGRLTAAIRTAKIRLTEIISSARARMGIRCSSTASYTRTISVPYQTGITSTTKTKIPSTTIHRITNAYPLKSIVRAINGMKNGAHSMRCILNKFALLPKPGTQVQTASKNTAASDRYRTKRLYQLIKNAVIAAISSKQKSLDMLTSIAPMPASRQRAAPAGSTTLSAYVRFVPSHSPAINTQTKKLVPARVQCVRDTGKRSAVYDLAVEGQHEFVVSGILVHNCWDAIRYGLDGYIQRRGALGVWAKLGMGK